MRRVIIGHEIGWIGNDAVSGIGLRVLVQVGGGRLDEYGHDAWGALVLETRWKWFGGRHGTVLSKVPRENWIMG